MLEDLQVKDFALIDTVSIDFSKGFTVLSGETGAGKSILIGAVSFLLGGKGGLEIIRTGTHAAQVSGTLFIPETCTEGRLWLSEHDVELENDRVLLRRVVKDTGKTAAWINDTPVTRSDLAEFTSNLVDIHGQHEHQSLMYPQKHRVYLDAFAGIDEQVASFTLLYNELVEKRRALEEIDASGAERERRIEMLSFAVDEITNAHIHAGEDEELDAEEARLSQFEKLYSLIEDASGALNGDDAVVPSLKRTRQTMEHAAAVDASLSSLSERLESAFYELEDIGEELRSYKNGLVFDPARLEEVQERSAFLSRLARKYTSGGNGTASDLLDYAEKAQKELELLSDGSGGREKLASEVASLEKLVYEKAVALSSERKKAASVLSQQIEDVLAELGMKGTQFIVQVQQKPGDTVMQKCGPYGIDDIEFVFSANPGSPVRPLARIASGGELSRVMLAIKTVLSAADTVDTLVFDEIDTGIGGEIAVAVGHHMQQLAKKRQILCITHLASIAVCADNQLKIEKSVKDGSTSTHVHQITGDERVTEIARMLSGDAVSEASLQHARALLQN